MSVKSSLYEHLSGKTGIQTEFGNPPRIYPDKAPSGVAKPYTTFLIVNANHNNHLKGSSGLVEALLQFDVWSVDSPSNVAGVEAIRNELAGFYAGYWGTLTNKTAIRSCMLEQREESKELPVHGDETFLFRTRMTFRVWYVESLPTL